MFRPSLGRLQVVEVNYMYNLIAQNLCFVHIIDMHNLKTNR
jgi:hypothetical protein